MKNTTVDTRKGDQKPSDPTSRPRILFELVDWVLARHITKLHLVRARCHAGDLLVGAFLIQCFNCLG